MKFIIKMEIVFLIILVLVNPVFSQRCQITIDDLLGSWYSMKFVNNLKQTKSPCRSLTGTFYLFNLIKDQQTERYIWELIYPHEADGCYVTGISAVDDSSFSLQTLSRHIKNTTFYLLNRTTLQFIDGEKFEKTTDFPALVNELTISGVYRDDQNQIYFFYKDGLALWPTDKFYYEVGLDPTEFTEDYFFILDRKDENRHRLLYFYTTTPNLQLYKKRYDEEGMLEKEQQPFLILFRFEKEFLEYLNDVRFKELELKNKEQLRLLRNEIYARHRHSFNSPDLQAYFANQPWYYEFKDHKVTSEELSNLELEVLERIQSLEKELK